MKTFLGISAKLSLLAAVLCFSGCASIVSKSAYPVQIKSSPPGKKFVIKDDSGSVICSGRTPQSVKLKSGDGFFVGATYKVEFSAGNELIIDSSIDPWYFGNIIFGGLIGMCIVDPATGAMWKLPESVNATIYEEKPRRPVPQKTTSAKRTSSTKYRSANRKAN